MGLIANVRFGKMVCKDNWEEGCVGSSWHVYDESFSVEFEDKNDLIDKLGDYLSNGFGVDKDDFVKYVNNDCEPDRFDYCRGEDGDGFEFMVTEQNPDGYLADYTFYVEDVCKRINYDFN